MFIRRLILLSLVAICALNLAGCASFDHYQWHADPTMPVCAEVRWVQVEASRTKGLCADQTGQAPAMTSCVLGCVIVSPYSESEAKVLMVQDGLTLYKHERKHTDERMQHEPR